MLQRGTEASYDYYLLSRGKQIVEDKTQIVLKLRLAPFDKARADGVMFRFLINGGAGVNLTVQVYTKKYLNCLLFITFIYLSLIALI